MFKVFPICAFKDNYIWCIVNEHSKECVVVDPGDAAPVIKFLQEKSFKLTAILLTHHHWDHTNGVKPLYDAYDVPVYAPQDTPLEIPAIRFEKETSFTILKNLTFEVLFVPGHTLDHIAYYGDGKLFCGDTLFSAGCGRLFEGTAEMMYDSLMKLKTLPDDTEVYCAHEYTLANLKFALAVEPDNHAAKQQQQKVELLRSKQQVSLPSTIALEKQINPFLRSDCSNVIQTIQQRTHLEALTPVEVFKHTRLWKDQF